VAILSRLVVVAAARPLFSPSRESPHRRRAQPTNRPTNQAQSIKSINQSTNQSGQFFLAPPSFLSILVAAAVLEWPTVVATGDFKVVVDFWYYFVFAGALLRARRFWRRVRCCCYSYCCCCCCTARANALAVPFPSPGARGVRALIIDSVESAVR
jgi:hypothetical protein